MIISSHSILPGWVCNPTWVMNINFENPIVSCTMSILNCPMQNEMDMAWNLMNKSNQQSEWIDGQSPTPCSESADQKHEPPAPIIVTYISKVTGRYYWVRIYIWLYGNKEYAHQQPIMITQNLTNETNYFSPLFQAQSYYIVCLKVNSWNTLWTTHLKNIH